MGVLSSQTPQVGAPGLPVDVTPALPPCRRGVDLGWGTRTTAGGSSTCNDPTLQDVDRSFLLTSAEPPLVLANRSTQTPADQAGCLQTGRPPCSQGLSSCKAEELTGLSASTKAWDRSLAPTSIWAAAPSSAPLGLLLLCVAPQLAVVAGSSASRVCRAREPSSQYHFCPKTTSGQRQL